MGFIPEDKVNEVRDRASIVSVVSQYVNLKKMGANYKALCPFHPEKTPSFVVSEAKQIYHCFGCGKGGNVFTFLMEQAGLSFPEAIQKLANELGVELPKTSVSPQQDKSREKRELLFKINKHALIFFKDQLKRSKKAQSFLKKRGAKPEFVASFHVGFAPDEWHALESFLKKKGISQRQLIEVGLVVHKKPSGNCYDRFRNRIIFPLFDTSRRVLGFGGRGLDDQTIPKYLNSSDSPVYRKGRELYGLSHAIRTQGLSKRGMIIVEGYFDCLMLVQAGFTNVVATMGTALTQEHIDRVKRFTQRFFLLFDGDGAGRQAAARTFPLFMKAGIMPRVVDLPDGQDPDDFVQQQNRSAMIERFKSSAELIDFVLDRVASEEGALGSKTAMIEELIPHVAQLPEGVEREDIIRKMADRLQVADKWILKSLSERDQKGGHARPTGSKGGSGWQQQMRKEDASTEIELLEFFALFPDWLKLPNHQKILDFFGDLEVKMIGLEMVGQVQKMGKVDVPALLQKMKSDDLKNFLLKGILDKEGQNLNEADWKPVFRDCLKRVQKRHLESQEKRLLHEIQVCEQDSALESKKVELLNRYQEIVKKKQQFI